MDKLAALEGLAQASLSNPSMQHDTAHRLTHAVLSEIQRLRTGGPGPFSPSLVATLVESYSWDVPLFKELMAYVAAEREGRPPQ